MGRARALPFENINGEVCSHGCGNLARFITRNGKLLCESSEQSCNEVKRLMSSAVKKGIDTDQYRELQKGVHARRWNKLGAKEHHSKVMKEKWSDLDYHSKVSEKIAKKNRSESRRRENSSFSKLNWANSEYRDRTVLNQRKGLNQGPNKPELKVLKILNEYFPKQWSFTGTGKRSKVVGGKSPDFMHNSKSKIIEVFGRYWHSVHVEDDSQIRKDYFKDFGFDTLILWDDESVKEMTEKIISFNNV